MESTTVLNEAELDLVGKIRNFSKTGETAKTKLETDEKVLARVTDGIYRLPGSAIRELISNAYDADAENVIIDTDVPRFETITIRDDGNGMSIETLVNLLNHVGASAKKSIKGSSLKVTDENNSSLSLNKKRKLIGKIGIGLFSVAQLTRDFDIITKQKGTDYYLKARIRLHNYSEEYIKKKEKEYQDNLESSDKNNSNNNDIERRGASFETGQVEIWTDSTENIDAHGTDIVLRNIKKSARDQLRSVDIWGQEAAETDIENNTPDDDLLNSSKLEKPTYHVGNYFGSDGFEFYNSPEREPELPWAESAPADQKLPLLYNSVLSLTSVTTNPKLAIIFDNYLNMLWTLSLSVPLNYIEKHPFHYTTSEIPDTYILSNKLKGQATKFVPSDTNEPIGKILPSFENYVDIDFNVTIDKVKLFRPLKFSDLPKSNGAVKRPILFIGSYSPDLSGVDSQDSGGKLSFDAYFLWTPKVIPRDHNGVLVRVHNSSGTLFDETFMRHQVAEHTIKSQLTVEIFVNNGLDSALNIDRESFNVSHPHYQIMMKWLHQAIRQVVNKYKSIKKEAVSQNSDTNRSRYEDKLSRIVLKSIGRSGLDYSDVSNLYITEGKIASSAIKGEIPIGDLPMESITITRDRFLVLSGLTTSKSRKSQFIESKTEAIIQILESYNILNELSSEKRECLIEDILQVISFEA